MAIEIYDGCEECRQRGFLHMVDPFEIQRCDTCAPEGFSDDDAIELHRIRCGCDWPENDWQHAFMRAIQLNSLDECLAGAITEFELLAEDRSHFLRNLPVMAGVTAALLIRFNNRRSRSDNDHYLHSEIEWLTSSVALLVEQYDKGELPEHWFWELGDGVYNKEKDTWAARHPLNNAAEVHGW